MSFDDDLSSVIPISNCNDLARYETEFIDNNYESITNSSKQVKDGEVLTNTSNRKHLKDLSSLNKMNGKHIDKDTLNTMLTNNTTDNINSTNNDDDNSQDITMKITPNDNSKLNTKVKPSRVTVNVIQPSEPPLYHNPFYAKVTTIVIIILFAVISIYCLFKYARKVIYEQHVYDVIRAQPEHHQTQLQAPSQTQQQTQLIEQPLEIPQPIVQTQLQTQPLTQSQVLSQTTSAMSSQTQSQTVPQTLVQTPSLTGGIKQRMRDARGRFIKKSDQ